MSVDTTSICEHGTFLNRDCPKCAAEAGCAVSDIVERLRDDARRDRVTVYSAKEIAEIAARIAHLERMVAAADAMVNDYWLIAETNCPCEVCNAARAYDAVRKGEG